MAWTGSDLADLPRFIIVKMNSARKGSQDCRMTKESIFPHPMPPTAVIPWCGLIAHRVCFRDEEKSRDKDIKRGVVTVYNNATGNCWNLTLPRVSVPKALFFYTLVLATHSFHLFSSMV